MQVLVGTTPVKLTSNDRTRPIVQNLGPGVLYLETDGDVDPTTGLKLAQGDIFEFPTIGSNSDIWVVATQDGTDVRVIGL